MATTYRIRRRFLQLPTTLLLSVLLMGYSTVVAPLASAPLLTISIMPPVSASTLLLLPTWISRPRGEGTQGITAAWKTILAFMKIGTLQGAKEPLSTGGRLSA